MTSPRDGLWFTTTKDGLIHGPANTSHSMRVTLTPEAAEEIAQLIGVLQRTRRDLE